MSNTTMTPIREILRLATGSSDIHPFNGDAQSWMRLIQEKGVDSGFDALVDSILENGWEEGSGVSINNGYIHQGHHRLAAAILLGLDEIPVCFGYESVSPGTLSAHMRTTPLQNDFFTWEEIEAE